MFDKEYAKRQIKGQISWTDVDREWRKSECIDKQVKKPIFPKSWKLWLLFPGQMMLPTRTATPSVVYERHYVCRPNLGNVSHATFMTDRDNNFNFGDIVILLTDWGGLLITPNCALILVSFRWLSVSWCTVEESIALLFDHKTLPTAERWAPRLYFSLLYRVYGGAGHLANPRTTHSSILYQETNDLNVLNEESVFWHEWEESVAIQYVKLPVFNYNPASFVFFSYAWVQSWVYIQISYSY